MPSLFCATCVDYLLTSQWQKYVDQLAKASCKAEQRRLLDKGPPINISVSSPQYAFYVISGKSFARVCYL
jgi:hypothetical protein